MYSEQIDKTCSVCIHCCAVKGNETHIKCSLLGEYVPAAKDACPKFRYDIRKRKLRRRKPLPKPKYCAEDFKL